MPKAWGIEGTGLKRAVWAGLVWSVGFGLLGFFTTLSPVELLVPSAVGFGVVTLFSRVGSRGLAALWALLLLLWFGNLLDALVRHGHAFEAGRHLPEPAAAWIALACPLLLSTAVATGNGAEAKLWVVISISLLLFAPLAYLAPIAVDVGGSPLQSDGLVWAIILWAGPGPILLAGWVVRRLRDQGTWSTRVR
jgi:hypothetical protein